MSKTTIPTGGITADAINSTLIADDAISEEHLDPTAITASSEKSTLVAADKFLIADSAASNAIKFVQQSNLGSGTHVKLLGGTSSSATDHDFLNFMDATKYNTYLVNLTEISNGSGSNQRIDMSFVANTTVLTGNHYWNAVHGFRSNGSEINDNGESQGIGRLGQKLILNDANRGNNRFHINVDTSRDFGVNIFGTNWGYNSNLGDYLFTNYTIGYNSTATVTGIRLFESGANSFTFDYEIYGILK
tara:strand:+ start:206 stop:943 length:738 start_codon:yes stop_codon:yes gene_type:complete